MFRLADYVSLMIFISVEVCVLRHDKERHQDGLRKEQQGLKPRLFQLEYTLARDMSLQGPNQVQI